MSRPLWTIGEITAAIGPCMFSGDKEKPVTGVSIDSRALSPGDLFVAIKDARDGHEFVPAAFKAGAAAALVRRDYQLPPPLGGMALIHVDDPLRALERLAVEARARLAPSARVIAVTGSAGKTGTKEMLRAALATAGSAHAPAKSFNNHWGVPLTLARMPADTDYAVIEIGMNHAGEITPLTRMARPHIAIITNVLPVHIGHFADGEVGIANAKAEVLLGLERGGIAVLPFDSPQFPRLKAAADHLGLETRSFGARAGADARAATIRAADSGSEVEVAIAGGAQRYRVGIAGEHIAINSLAVVAVLRELGVDMSAALAPLADLSAPTGRGARSQHTVRNGRILLIDESYNANPASMRAALAVLGAAVPRAGGRRVAVIGDMRELGEDGPALHRSLEPSIKSCAIDAVFACGPLMRHLFDDLDPAVRGSWAATSKELCAPVLDYLRDGDIVMVKGSLGTNMAPIVAAISGQNA